MPLHTEKAWSYFNSRFGIHKSTNGWWAFDCPLCIVKKARKMAANFNCEIVKCWKCGYKESMTDFIIMYEEFSEYWEAVKFIGEFEETTVDIETIRNNEIVEASEVGLPKGYMNIMDGDGTLGRRAREYMQSRGFKLELLDRMGFGYCNDHAEDYKEDYFGRIIVPFKRKGKLVYFLGRDYLGDSLRYKNPPTAQFGIGKADVLFNEDALELYDTICVLEGWSDALTIGRKAVATLGWSLSKYQLGALHRSPCENLVFIPDIGEDNNGVSFYTHAVKTAMEFIETKKEVYVLNMQEAGLAQYGKDVNEIGRKRVIDLLKETPVLTFETALKHLMS